jgi:hypothetical protein
VIAERRIIAAGILLASVSKMHEEEKRGDEESRSTITVCLHVINWVIGEGSGGTFETTLLRIASALGPMVTASGEPVDVLKALATGEFPE